MERLRDLDWAQLIKREQADGGFGTTGMLHQKRLYDDFLNGGSGIRVQEGVGRRCPFAL